MRKIDLKSRNIKGLCLILTAVMLLGAGCRDNPQDKAAKEVHQQIQAALKQSDIVAAQQHIQSALSRHRPAGLAQDSAQLVTGNLAFSQALSLVAELPLKTVPIRTAVADISTRLNRSQQWLLEKERLEKMLALQDAEIVELKTLITGDAEQPGLQARLADAQAEMAELVRQRQTARQERDAVQAVIDDYQARSEALLRQADLAKGDDKLNLQQQAYDLRLQRKDDYVKAQAAENIISVLDDRIELVQLRIQSLENNLLETQTSIHAIETAESRRLLKSQQAEIDQLLSEQQKTIYESADAIKTGLTAYRQAAEEAIEELERTDQQYQRVRSNDALLPAIVRRADCCTYAALTCAEQMIFLREIAVRLTGIVEAFGAANDTGNDILVRGLAERLPLSAEFNPEQFQRAMAFFDQADSLYDEAMSLARQIPLHGREAAASVLNNQLLAVQSKMQLADALAQYDVASETQARLEALRQTGLDFGTLFTHSETARLLDKGLTYVPVLPVNVELYFEGIRQRFTEWRRQVTPDEKAAAVERNFVEMDELIQTYGDEMARLLEPLRQEMLEAKERDFVAPVAPAAATPADPNNF